MRLLVAGDIKNPVLLDTEEATSLLLTKDNGDPVMLIRFLPDGKGFVRLTKGEDKNFEDTIKHLGLNT